jgi:hypothetical protein
VPADRDYGEQLGVVAIPLIVPARIEEKTGDKAGKHDPDVRRFSYDLIPSFFPFDRQF